MAKKNKGKQKETTATTDIAMSPTSLNEVIISPLQHPEEPSPLVLPQQLLDTKMETLSPEDCSNEKHTHCNTTLFTINVSGLRTYNTYACNTCSIKDISKSVRRIAEIDNKGRYIKATVLDILTVEAGSGDLPISCQIEPQYPWTQPTDNQEMLQENFYRQLVAAAQPGQTVLVDLRWHDSIRNWAKVASVSLAAIPVFVWSWYGSTDGRTEISKGIIINALAALLISISALAWFGHRKIDRIP
ncbi:hypothetical protein EDC01DRAFT_752211 [Geopyxis carbonaria]|nr:hypothetical protein EDC01DRAFT_752211 [Geopyxis carbonaria]